MILEHLNIRDLHLPSRIRKDYNEEVLRNLSTSFEEIGITNPIYVSHRSNFDFEVLRDLLIEDDHPDYIIIAGGTRYNAALISSDKIKSAIPCNIVQQPINTLYEYRKLEYTENTLRSSFSWQEDYFAVTELIITGGLQHYKTDKKGKPTGEFCQELGISRSRLDSFKKMTYYRNIGCKSLLEAKSIDEALRIGAAHEKLYQKQLVTNALIAKKESEKAEGSHDAVVYNKMDYQDEKQLKLNALKATYARVQERYQTLKDSYLNCNFFDLAEKLIANGEKFAVISLDPPYAIDLKESKKAKDDKLSHYNEVAKEEYTQFMTKVFRYCKQLLQPNGTLLCWHADEWSHILKDILASPEVDLRTAINDIIWVKPSGQTKAVNHNFANCVERCLYTTPVGGAILKPGRSNVFNFKPVSPTNKWHPTQRPMELIEEVFSCFLLPNTSDKILIPFAGSGMEIFVAANMGLSAVTCDLAPEYKTSFDEVIERLPITDDKIVQDMLKKSGFPTTLQTYIHRNK